MSKNFILSSSQNAEFELLQKQFITFLAQETNGHQQGNNTPNSSTVTFNEHLIPQNLPNLSESDNDNIDFSKIQKDFADFLVNEVNNQQNFNSLNRSFKAPKTVTVKRSMSHQPVKSNAKLWDLNNKKADKNIQKQNIKFQSQESLSQEENVTDEPILFQKEEIRKPKKALIPIQPPMLNPFLQFNFDGIPTVPNEINILIIGETGVGKSTWINGIANYTSFNTFDDALLSEKPACLIPMNFNLFTGDNFEKTEIKMLPTVGEIDKNEAESSSGQSCTQEPKVYRFVTDTVIFNLIDTPGIGDTRGIENDMANMKMLIKCLAKWDKIHGICLLLKPNESRLRLSLRYCVEELLVNLHKNCIPNIVVVFTNSCNTLYKPGDTMNVLQKLINDVKGANGNLIQINSSNTFCIDNEAVRMLYAHHKGIKFEKPHIESFEKSWSHTVMETFRMFEYISLLSPHFVSETKAIYQIRGIFLELCTIMAEKSNEILQNKKVTKQQKLQVKNRKISLAKKLKSNTYKIQCIKETSLNYPIIVCSGPNCIETVKDANDSTTKIFYKQICCSSCHLTSAKRNQCGDISIRECHSFNTNSGKCQSCGCLWRSHMQIWYSQTKTLSDFHESNSEEEEEQDAIKATSKSMNLRQNNLRKFRHRYDVIKEICLVCIEFLRKNAILVLNDAVVEYLNVSIQECEKATKVGDERAQIERLQNLLEIYQQQTILSKPAIVVGIFKKIFRILSGIALWDYIFYGTVKEITMENYAKIAKNLEKHRIIGSSLKNSANFQDYFEGFSTTFQMIEISPKIEISLSKSSQVRTSKRKGR